jgi:polyisoprenoid-binding protein YceI
MTVTVTNPPVTTTDPATGTYAIDPAHSRVGFSARHALITKVRGSFTDFAGTGVFDPAHPEAIQLALTIQAASIDTGNADRDAHLRSNDFLDLETHPTLAFTSTAVTSAGQGIYQVTGDLTIKGITHSVTIPFAYQGAATDPFGNHRIGFEGSTVINRKDYGVSWNAPLDAGGVLVGEQISLEFDVSAIKQ